MTPDSQPALSFGLVDIRDGPYFSLPARKKKRTVYFTEIAGSPPEKITLRELFDLRKKTARQHSSRAVAFVRGFLIAFHLKISTLTPVDSVIELKFDSGTVWGPCFRVRWRRLASKPWAVLTSQLLRKGSIQIRLSQVSNDRWRTRKLPMNSGKTPHPIDGESAALQVKISLHSRKIGDRSSSSPFISRRALGAQCNCGPKRRRDPQQGYNRKVGVLKAVWRPSTVGESGVTKVQCVTRSTRLFFFFFTSLATATSDFFYFSMLSSGSQMDDQHVIAGRLSRGFLAGPCLAVLIPLSPATKFLLSRSRQLAQFELCAVLDVIRGMRALIAYDDFSLARPPTDPGTGWRWFATVRGLLARITFCRGTKLHCFSFMLSEGRKPFNWTAGRTLGSGRLLPKCFTAHSTGWTSIRHLDGDDSPNTNVVLPAAGRSANQGGKRFPFGGTPSCIAETVFGLLYRNP